jgi:DNA-binding winged helix-turn-helix (wHTH) protein
MAMDQDAARFRFGGFELQPGEHRLLAHGQLTAVGPRAFDLLVALVERAGKLVSKDELLERVWPKLVVEENNLQVQVSAPRRNLGPEALDGNRSGLPVHAGA